MNWLRELLPDPWIDIAWMDLTHRWAFTLWLPDQQRYRIWYSQTLFI